MKKSIIWILAVLAVLTTTAAVLQYQQVVFSEKMVRLHVVANSDSHYDQQLKLQVRDAVVAVTKELENKQEVAAALPEIQQAAERCLRENGSNEHVSVTLKKEQFPTRVYHNFSLPSGVYSALRVTIGEGKGHNWWCVAFPSICFRATAADLEQAAVSAGFSESEVELITEDGGYVLKFKALELLESLKDRIF